MAMIHRQHREDVYRRAIAWLTSDHAGTSSTFLLLTYLGLAEPYRYSHPRDRADVMRCVKLIELIPEVGQTLEAMNQYQEWKAYGVPSIVAILNANATAKRAEEQSHE